MAYIIYMDVPLGLKLRKLYLMFSSYGVSLKMWKCQSDIPMKASALFLCHLRTYNNKIDLLQTFNIYVLSTPYIRLLTQ